MITLRFIHLIAVIIYFYRPKFVIMKFHLLAWLVVVAILSLSLTGKICV